MRPAWVETFVEATFWIGLTYGMTLLVFVFILLALASIENRKRLHQRDVEDDDAIQRSRFTIPVSILAPALNEAAVILPAVRSLLAQDYPEFEVILIDDGSTDETLEILKEAFGLERKEVFYRKVLPCAEVRGVYQSPTEPRLTVVSKDNGGTKADPLNCGMNFARFRYVCCVDGDTIFHTNALLRAMSLVMKDPGSIVGAASLFSVSREPELEATGADGRRAFDRSLLSAFQHLEILRSFVSYRLAWSRIGSMLCNPGAFALWRRDLVLECGGFSRDFTCEDIEFTFRVHRRFRKEKRRYQVLSLPFLVARTEGPETLKALVRQRARWQRVVLETVWAFRGMTARPGYGAVGTVGMPYYVLFEALAPVVQVVVLAAFLLAAWFHMLSWPVYLSFLGFVVFASAVPTTLAVHLHDTTYRDHHLRDLAWMLLLGPLELFLYRPVLIYAGIKGAKDWLKGEKGWHKFERNRRSAAPKDPAG